jgi:replicative DNA helicase
MTTGRKGENRTQEITTISRKLKRLAMTEQVPVIALSQLNRQVENRDKHRPRLSDLRESGSIEQDADVVMLLHREDYYRRQNDPNAPQDGTAEAIIAKNRRGSVGTASLIFLDEKVTFGDKTNFSESLINE